MWKHIAAQQTSGKQCPFSDGVTHLSWLDHGVWSFYNILLKSVCSYFVEDFCICVHQGYWPVTFFSCSILVWFWSQGYAHLVKWVWKCSLSFFGSLWEGLVLTLLWMFCILHQWNCLVLVFCWDVSCLIISNLIISNLITSNWSVQIFYFFMILSWWLYVSRNLSISSRLSSLLAGNCS